MRKNGLTSFQEQFCLAYIQSGNASEAYRAVSLKSRAWKDEVVWVAAHRMMNVSKVGIRIAELQETIARRAMVTAESLADELDHAIALAVREGQAGAYVAAVMGKAKLYGLLVDKKEVRAGPLDDLTPHDLKLLDDLIASAIDRGAQTDETNIDGRAR